MKLIPMFEFMMIWGVRTNSVCSHPIPSIYCIMRWEAVLPHSRRSHHHTKTNKLSGNYGGAEKVVIPFPIFIVMILPLPLLKYNKNNIISQMPFPLELLIIRLGVG